MLFSSTVPREVRSFNPDEDKVWFCNAPLGLNTLNAMMKSMSSRAGIQPHLTNQKVTQIKVASHANCKIVSPTLRQMMWLPLFIDACAIIIMGGYDS